MADYNITKRFQSKTQIYKFTIRLFIGSLNSTKSSIQKSKDVEIDRFKTDRFKTDK